MLPDRIARESVGLRLFDGILDIDEVQFGVAEAPCEIDCKAGRSIGTVPSHRPQRGFDTWQISMRRSDGSLAH